MLTLNSTSGTGLFLTTPGANGVISSTGPIAPNSYVKVSYSHSGASSGIFAGLAIYKGNFAESIVFPGSNLKFEIVNPDSYNSINVEVVPTA